MNYPLISEYIEAIKAAEDNFEKLTNLRAVLGDDGQPVMTSGNFAVVFKMKDEETGKLYALKCFTKEQQGREEAYHQIAEELKDVDSPYLVSLRYLEKELFVDTEQTDETEFPVLLMDWVEGKTLDKYLRENLDDKYTLEMLAYRFSQLAQWLIPQPFAHGDLKPDNILVREDGSLVLVDYDGMYVPSMKGQKARELGSPDFRHPLRTENDFDEHIDDFPLVSILLSLKAISIEPHILLNYGESYRLLFSYMDYYDISQCKLFEIFDKFEDSELGNLVWLFKRSFEHIHCSELPFYINLHRPRPIYSELTTRIKKDELIFDKTWLDEKGVRYSKDRTKLLKGPIIDYIKDFYRVHKATKVICDSAFSTCWGFERVYLPNGLVLIGDHAFTCLNLKYINIPNTVVAVGNWAFYHCGITSLSMPSSVKAIGEWAFAGCENLKELNLSNGISRLENGVFSGCYELEEVVIPNSVEFVGKNSFSYCKKLRKIYLPNKITEVGDDPFVGCENLTSIVVPEHTKWWYENLLPNDKDKIIEINRETRVISPEVSKVDLNNVWTDEFGVTYSSDRTCLFKAPTKQIKRGNHNWTKSVLNGTYSVKPGTQYICDRAFLNCYGLNAVILPQSVKQIGDRSFQGCFDLCTVELNDGLIIIGDNAFRDCIKLHSILLPKSIQQVGNNAFYGCMIKVHFSNYES